MTASLPSFIFELERNLPNELTWISSSSQAWLVHKGKRLIVISLTANETMTVVVNLLDPWYMSFSRSVPTYVALGACQDALAVVIGATREAGQ